MKKHVYNGYVCKWFDTEQVDAVDKNDSYTTIDKEYAYSYWYMVVDADK